MLVQLLVYMEIYLKLYVWRKKRPSELCLLSEIGMLRLTNKANYFVSIFCCHYLVGISDENFSDYVSPFHHC